MKRIFTSLCFFLVSIIYLILSLNIKASDKYTINSSEIFNFTNINSDSSHYIVAVADLEKLSAILHANKSIELKNLKLENNKTITLELNRKRSIIDAKTVFLVQTAIGEEKHKAPDLISYSGTVAGEQYSRAYLIIVNGEIFGTITDKDKVSYVITPGTGNYQNMTIIAAADKIKEDKNIFLCLSNEVNKPFDNKFIKSTSKLQSKDLLEVKVAVETDTDFFDNTGGTPEKAQAYALAIFTMVDAIYEEQLNVSVYIPWLKCWTDSHHDPYNVGGNAYALPDTVRQYWKTHYQNVQRDLFHVMTSVSYGGGGFGYFNALCNKSEYSFSVSSVQASHCFPTFAFNYDTYIVAHEMGHNFNGQHTHSCYWKYPLDTCITSDAIAGGCLDSLVTPRPNPGSIMSYCGGTNEQFGLGYQVRMLFLPQNVELMRQTAENADCLQPVNPEIVLLKPNGTESYQAGDSIVISWNSSRVGDLSISFTTDDGNSWNDIAQSVLSSDMQYKWKAPDLCSNSLKVRLNDVINPLVGDTSLMPFSIYSTVPGDLLGYYPFSGNSKDQICGGFPDAIPVNNPVLVPDRFGSPNSAYKFDGTNYLYIPDAGLTSDELTVCFWFNASDLSNKKFMVGTNFGPALNVFESYFWGLLGSTFYIGSGSGYFQTWAGGAVTNKWYFLAFAYDGKTVRDYVNGVKTKTEDKAGPLLKFTTTLYIGARKGNEPFSGSIDDIRIYKRALSDDEISALFNEIPSSVEDDNDNSIAEIYPNPSKDKIFIGLKGALNQKVIINVVNTARERLISLSCSDVKSSGKF